MEPGLVTYNQCVNECKSRIKHSRYLTTPNKPLVSPQATLGSYIKTDFKGSQFPHDEDRNEMVLKMLHYLPLNRQMWLLAQEYFTGCLF
jgi:hypothetical protein